MKNRFRARPARLAVAAQQTAVEAAANTITTNRVMAWHGACTAALIEFHRIDEVQASEVAMALFEQANGTRPFLAWQDPRNVALAWKLPEGGA